MQLVLSDHKNDLSTFGKSQFVLCKALQQKHKESIKALNEFNLASGSKPQILKKIPGEIEIEILHSVLVSSFNISKESLLKNGEMVLVYMNDNNYLEKSEPMQLIQNSSEFHAKLSLNSSKMFNYSSLKFRFGFLLFNKNPRKEKDIILAIKYLKEGFGQGTIHTETTHIENMISDIKSLADSKEISVVCRKSLLNFLKFSNTKASVQLKNVSQGKITDKKRELITHFNKIIGLTQNSGV